MIDLILASVLMSPVVGVDLPDGSLLAQQRYIYLTNANRDRFRKAFSPIVGKTVTYEQVSKYFGGMPPQCDGTRNYYVCKWVEGDRYLKIYWRNTGSRDNKVIVDFIDYQF